MIKELIPLLTTHNLGLDVRIKDNALHVHVIPKLIDESIKDAKDLNILERPLFRSYKVEEFTNEDLAHELNNYQSALGEGTDIITTLAKEIEQRAKEKLQEEKAKATKSAAKKPATKRATTAKPKRKTKQQLMDEAREKQAQERKDEKPAVVETNRLEDKPEPPAITPTPPPADDDPLGLGLGGLDL